MPDLEKAYQQMGSKKLIVLAVGMGEDKSSIRGLPKSMNLHFQ
ncbi:MAG: hypothetical protein Ct9H300mP28_17660 [Pseudomonadota bacterium]|nr:MAG: hypothetical protein Ct9H300mP28_17660 [Pseudomonadota bacterium]